MMGVDEASECLSGAESLLIRGERVIVVRDVLALVFPTGNEGRVEDGSRLRGGSEFSVHLGVLGELGCGNMGQLEARRCGTWE